MSHFGPLSAVVAAAMLLVATPVTSLADPTFDFTADTEPVTPAQPMTEEEEQAYRVKPPPYESPIEPATWGADPAPPLPVEIDNPKSRIVPGQMASDRLSIPGEFTKDEADRAEVKKAQLKKTRKKLALSESFYRSNPRAKPLLSARLGNGSCSNVNYVLGATLPPDPSIPL